MSQTKEELMAEILEMDKNIASDKETQQWLASLDPAIVKGFEVIEKEKITIKVGGVSNEYTDTSVFSSLLANMLTEISTNIAAREASKTAKEAELKELLP